MGSWLKPCIYAACLYSCSTSPIGPRALTFPASSTTPVAQMRSSRAAFCEASTRIPARSTNSSSRRLAFSTKVSVADAEPLVHQQNLGLEAGAHRECEPEPHTERVGMHRHRQIVAELGERRDLVHALLHLLGHEPQEQSACHDVLVACRFGIDSERYVQQRSGSAAPPHLTASRLVSPRKHPQQGRFARAVVSDEPDSIAVLERQGSRPRGHVRSDGCGNRARCARPYHDAAIYSSANACWRCRRGNRPSPTRSEG